MLTFFLGAETAAWGSSWAGVRSTLRQRMSCSNDGGEFRAWSWKRERETGGLLCRWLERDYKGGESVDGRMERDGEEGGCWNEREKRSCVALPDPTLIKRNFTSQSDARPPDVEKKKRAKNKRLSSAVFYASSCLKSQRASPRPSLTQNL
jgi:hypothetical protein